MEQILVYGLCQKYFYLLHQCKVHFLQPYFLNLIIQIRQEDVDHINNDNSISNWRADEKTLNIVNFLIKHCLGKENYS